MRFLDRATPPEPIGTKATTIGTVKWFRDEKGYGCIASDATSPYDIWCHFSAIEKDGYKSFQVGQRVEVEYERQDQDSFRYIATRARDAGGAA